MSASSRPRRRTPLRLRLLLLGFAVLVPLAAIEGLLHAFPKLLPASFRRLYPPNGVEFFQPGVLEKTPITAVPLPFPVDPYSGPPPHDLIDQGIAPADAAVHDRTASPTFVLPSDALGLPNGADVPAAAPIALVGDSFTVYGAQQDPPGFVRTLASSTGHAVRNVAVSGIGPDQELFLLQQVVLPAQPKLVVWMFFGGNDLADAFWSQVHRAQGMRTFADQFHDRRAPRLWLPSLLASFLRSAQQPSIQEPLPPFRLADARPDTAPLWFFPDALRAMALPKDRIVDNPGWLGITTALRSARDACQQANVPLLVVYLPSKEQVYLPHIVADGELLRRYALASGLAAIPLPDTGDATRDQLLQQRGALEQALVGFCGDERIACWSASPAFAAIAARGEAAYYTTDTHWRPQAQAEIARALAAELTARTLLPR